MTRRDMVSGIVLGAGALVLYVYASGFPVRAGQPAAVSAGFYPRLLALLLGGLSTIQVVSAVVAERRARAERGDGATAAPAAAPRWWKDRDSLVLLAVTFALLLAYPFVLGAFGFIASAFSFLVVLTYLLSAGQRSGRQLLWLIVLTVALTIVTYLVFRVFLQIPFPRGGIFQP